MVGRHWKGATEERQKNTSVLRLGHGNLGLEIDRTSLDPSMRASHFCVV